MSSKTSQIPEVKHLKPSPLTSDDLKEQMLKLKEKKLDFFHSLSKYVFTVVVLGAIVLIIQNDNNFSYKTIIFIFIGSLASYFLYLTGNNFLKDK